ncbi:MAG TPA: accessory factor UbiK family protein [Salinisphaeraceae bacterium]|nr:accessory factor UbiK family protein [Salinisphaeraceae bacterium]
MDIRALEDIAERLAGMLPPQMEPLREELQANFRALLQSRLARLDLVPRAEFEAAREALAQTRAQLDELERQVAALEEQRDPGGQRT